jgi:HEXXH motif-containing protein
LSPMTGHGVPAHRFAELASGGSAEAVQLLVEAQYSKHVILLHRVATMARSAQDQIALAGWDLLAEVQRQDLTAARAVITYPSVGAWAMHTVRGDRQVPGAQPACLAALAAAAAIRAGLDAEIEVPVIDGMVVLPSLGLAQVPDAETVTVRTATAEIYPGGERWQDLRRAKVGDLDVTLDDLDPFRMPATDGRPTSRLTEAELTAFTAPLEDAWYVLTPASAKEIAAIVRVVVPYQAPEEGLVSTSSAESFGTVAMSRQPDKYTCAETLVHETQHLKLCALLDLVALTQPDNGQRYYAPWRSDPRPASGLLQGAYAFFGVSGFWRGQRETAPEAEVRNRAEAAFARWRDGAAQVAQTLLGSKQLTEEGQSFVATMARVLADWQREPVPSVAREIAQREADRHRTQWQADNNTGGND